MPLNHIVSLVLCVSFTFESLSSYFLKHNVSLTDIYFCLSSIQVAVDKAEAWIVNIKPNNVSCLSRDFNWTRSEISKPCLYLLFSIYSKVHSTGCFSFDSLKLCFWCILINTFEYESIPKSSCVWVWWKHALSYILEP